MIILPIDIVGLAQANGMSQTVKGEARIDTGSRALDEQIRAIFWRASQDAYAVLAVLPRAEAEHGDWLPQP